MKRKQLNVFKNLPTLETERLILKKITQSTLEDVYEYRSDPKVSRYLLWSPDENREKTRAYLEYLDELYAKGKFYDFGIFLKESGKMIGTVGFTTINLRDNSASVGYVLNSSFWGQGIAKEALEKIIDFAFCELGFATLYARLIDGNEGSKRVLEKCGFDFYCSEQKLLYVKERMEKILVYYLRKPSP